MTGNEKGGQKRNPDLLGQGTKEKQSVNNLAYPYSRWRSKSSTTCLTQKSGRGSFRSFLLFNILLIISTYIRKPWVLSGCRKKGAMEGILLLLYYREEVSIAPTYTIQ